MSVTDTYPLLSSQIRYTHNTSADDTCKLCAIDSQLSGKGEASGAVTTSEHAHSPISDSSNHPLANQVTIDPSELFSGATVMSNRAQVSEPLDGTPTYSVIDADPDRPGMQIDVVVSRNMSPVDFKAVENMLRQDIKVRAENGWPPVEYYVYRNQGAPGEHKYGGDPSGNGVNFLDFTAMQDSDPNREGIQIDVVIDPRTAPSDQQKIFTALQEWSNAITHASGTAVDFYVWSDKSKVAKQGEFLNFTPLKDNGDSNFNGKTYWGTPVSGRIVAFEPGAPLSIVMHEIGHALPLPAHTDGVMKDVNPTTTIDPETLERVLRIYDLTGK